MVQARSVFINGDGGCSNALLGGQPHGAISGGGVIDLDLIFLVAAGILGSSAADDAVCDADDHGEPNDGEKLNGQQEAKEYPLDRGVHANWVLHAQEGSEHVRNAIRVTVRADHLCGTARVAAVGHCLRDGLVSRPPHNVIQDVAGDDPGGHEDTEGDVAGVLELEVLENLGRLLRELVNINARFNEKVADDTYGK